MAEYTVKTSSKFILFYEEENAEIDPDALLQKIADEKTQQLKEKVKKPKIDKSEKLKPKAEATKPEPVAKKDLVNENQPLKSPDKKFNAQKQDGRPPRFANKRGGADQQQNKENITSSSDDWGNSGNDWGTSGASVSNDKAPNEDWTTSPGFQKASNQARGGSGANRRGGSFSEFNGPRVPRNFDGRGEFRSRGRGNFNRGGFQSTEVGVEGEKKPGDFGDDVLKSEEQQNFGSRGGYRGGRGAYRRDDEGGDFRPRGRGRGRGRSHIEEGGLVSGTNAGTGEDWGTSETVEAMAPTSGETFDQQNTNFGRSGRRNFGGVGFRGSRGGRGSSFGRGREFDRHSGSDKTGIKAVDRKDGAGTGNWGTAEDDLKAESDALGFENTEPATNWDADESHDDNKDDKQDGTKSTAPEITFMTLEEYKAKKKLEAAAMEQLRSQTESNARIVNDGFKDDAFKNMYEYRKIKEDSEADESDEEEEVEENSIKPGHNKEVLFDFKFNDNDRRGGAPGGGFRGGRSSFGRAGRGGNFRGGRGGARGRDDGEGGHNLPAANIRLDDETDFPTLKGH